MRVSGRGCKSKAAGSASGTAALRHLPPTLQSLVAVASLPSKKRTVSHRHLSLESFAPLAAAGQEPDAPRAAAGTLQGQQPGVQHRLLMQELRRTSQACSWERKRSTSAGREEAKVSDTSCFSLFTGSRTRCTYKPGRAVHWPQHWAVPAPEDAGGKEQMLSSLLGLPQLPQHAFTLAVGSSSRAPTGVVGY